MLFIHNADATIGGIGGRSIGKVGSPVVPSNEPKTKVDKNGDGNPDGDDGTIENAPRNPLLVITFNKQRINFGRVLGQAVVANERENGNARYDVISRISNSSGNPDKQTRLNKVYSKNLNTVLQEMQRIGISQDRIKVNTEYKVDNSPQEIAVYADQK